MADTNVPITAGSGINIDARSESTNGDLRQVIVIGDPSTNIGVAPVDSIKGLTTQAYQIPSPLAISITGASAAAVTATLPAVTSQFHYISIIEITKYFTVANAASATPLVVTTTNLPGGLAFTFGQPLGTIGTTDVKSYTLSTPLISSVSGTPTTITCPATTGILWRINVLYYTAP